MSDTLLPEVIAVRNTAFKETSHNYVVCSSRRGLVIVSPTLFEDPTVERMIVLRDEFLHMPSRIDRSDTARPLACLC